MIKIWNDYFKACCTEMTKALTCGNLIMEDADGILFNTYAINKYLRPKYCPWCGKRLKIRKFAKNYYKNTNLYGACYG